jgi:DNA polymerase
MDTRREVIDRLEWLRLLGVDGLRAGGRAGGAGADAASGRAAGAAPGGPAPASQSALFGTPEVEPAPPRRRAGEEPGPRLETTSPPEGADPAARLAAIRADLGDCRRCRLCEQRTTVVFGVGSPDARVLFVGEGPGADEDRQGEPFVGRAGQLLNKIIEAMGMTRGEVYIANVVKCRPPENRTPRPDEVGTCAPFLFRQIQSIRPRVIVCLGTPAAQAILGTGATISRLRGQFREIDGMRVMPTYHPAYLLRNPAAKRDVWDDMKQVVAFLQDDAAGR